MPNVIPVSLNRIQNALESRRDGQLLWDWLDGLGDEGSIPVWSVNMATEPTTADTLTIGADVYEFVTTAGAVTSDSNIAVELTGTVADTRDNFVDAVNAINATNAHANITDIATTGAALANGTENVLAVEAAATVVITTAVTPGGARASADPSIVLAEALTDASDIWSYGDVNVNTLAGAARAARESAVTSVAITAAMITFGTVRVDFPWQPSHFMVTIMTSAGIPRNTQLDTFTVTANGVLLTLAGGAAPDVQATDVVTVAAWE